MKPTIRPWTVADRDAVVALNAELQEHERAIRPSRAPGAEISERYVTRLARRLEKAGAGGALLVAELDGHIVGFVACYLDEDELEVDPRELVIGDLVVTTTARRRGVARMLVSAARAFAVERGIRRLTISSIAGNEMALRTYRALGFKEALVTLEMAIAIQG